MYEGVCMWGVDVISAFIPLQLKNAISLKLREIVMHVQAKYSPNNSLNFSNYSGFRTLSLQPII